MMMDFSWGKRTYVMGIINITPDSFSGDGLLRQEDPARAAVEQALAFTEQGVDILDVGGESSRPGSTILSAAEELGRILPVVLAIRQVCELPISVDTWKAEVAREAIHAGADWINDIWALQADPDMARTAAELGCEVVLMHNRSRAGEVILKEELGGSYRPGMYGDVVLDVIDDLTRAVRLALDAGIRPEKIILDPGIGFGKTVRQNLDLINRLDEIRALGYPVLLGPSRKSFIGEVLNLPAQDRLEGTLAALSVGIARGADIVRVHDVRAAVRTARMTDALVRTA
jgi:dihydropteroate synthase